MVKITAPRAIFSYIVHFMDTRDWHPARLLRINKNPKILVTLDLMRRQHQIQISVQTSPRSIKHRNSHHTLMSTNTLFKVNHIFLKTCLLVLLPDICFPKKGLTIISYRWADSNKRTIKLDAIRLNIGLCRSMHCNIPPQSNISWLWSNTTSKTYLIIDSTGIQIF